MEDWDSIDWDEKVKGIVKKQQKQQQEENPDENSKKIEAFKYLEDDGNYYETNVEKERIKDARKASNRSGSSNDFKRTVDTFIQAYSLKDLIIIREYISRPASFHNLIDETFGQFERFLLTHKVDLSHEAIVELLNIDVNLLEIPFYSHNQLLLVEISKLESFWSQLVYFLKEFLDQKHKDLKFLLTVDMNGFIENIEYMMHNLLVNNLFSSQIELVFNEILMVMKNFTKSKWSQPDRLQNLYDDYRRNLKDFKIYDVSSVSN